MRSMARMRDHLAPWLIVAVCSVAFLPLILSAGCEVACELSAMPTGTCGHLGMTGAHPHASAPLVSTPALEKVSAALAVLLGAVFALAALAAALPSASVAGLVPAEARDGTRLRI